MITSSLLLSSDIIITNIITVQYEDIDTTYRYKSVLQSEAAKRNRVIGATVHDQSSSPSPWTHVEWLASWPGCCPWKWQRRELRPSCVSDVTSSCSVPPSANRELAGPASRAASTERRSACGRRTWGVPLTACPLEDNAAPFHGQGTWSYRPRLSDRRNLSSYQICQRKTQQHQAILNITNPK